MHLHKWDGLGHTAVIPLASKKTISASDCCWSLPASWPHWRFFKRNSWANARSYCSVFVVYALKIMDIAKNSNAPAKRWLVDASIYIFRAYFSLPPNWESENGYSTEAVYGFTNFLLDLRAAGPTHVGLCFDESLETGFRHRLYPMYKSSRALPDEALAFQLAACREVAETLGFACFASEEYEADDLIGCLLTQLHKQADPVAILTRDKDLGQLLTRPQDYLWDYAADKLSFAQDIFDRFGVWPGQMVDYLALVGDSSDDIPGVPGIGAKTAASILATGSLADYLVAPELLASLPLRGAKSLVQKLADAREQIALAQQLATIIVDQPQIQQLQQLRPHPINQEEALAILRVFGIGGLSKKLRKLCSACE